VAHHLKHGMMTVRPAGAAVGAHDHTIHAHGAHAGVDSAPHAAPNMVMGGEAPWPPVPVMALLSFQALAAGVTIAVLLRPA
jgi:hypothetical protein